MKQKKERVIPALEAGAAAETMKEYNNKVTAEAESRAEKVTESRKVKTSPKKLEKLAKEKQLADERAEKLAVEAEKLEAERVELEAKAVLAADTAEKATRERLSAAQRRAKADNSSVAAAHAAIDPSLLTAEDISRCYSLVQSISRASKQYDAAIAASRERAELDAARLDASIKAGKPYDVEAIASVRNANVVPVGICLTTRSPSDFIGQRHIEIASVCGFYGIVAEKLRYSEEILNNSEFKLLKTTDLNGVYELRYYLVKRGRNQVKNLFLWSFNDATRLVKRFFAAL